MVVVVVVIMVGVVVVPAVVVSVVVTKVNIVAITLATQRNRVNDFFQEITSSFRNNTLTCGLVLDQICLGYLNCEGKT